MVVRAVRESTCQRVVPGFATPQGVTTAVEMAHIGDWLRERSSSTGRPERPCPEDTIGSRRFTTRVEQRRHDDQRAGYDEGHPAPSDEPQDGPASSATTPPAMVTQPHEGKLEAVYDVWRMRRDVATAAKRRPRLSV